MHTPEVYKLGGASIRDNSSIHNVATLLLKTATRPLVVVISAMGKTTNHLEAIIQAHYHQPDMLYERMDSLKRYHEEIAESLMGDQAGDILADLHDLWVELEWILEEDPQPNYNYHYDQIIVFGELASTKIVSAYLELQGLSHQWMDARSLLKTDSAFREARIQWEPTQLAVDSLLRPALDAKGIVLTQGFIGSTPNNESTSLGREGSDYTAAVLAFTLDASSVTIWKDVPGIMTGDPARFEQVVLLDEISYKEAIEMTYYGAKVIHPKTIKPLQNKNIPLFVRPFNQPDQPGTRISDTPSLSLPPVMVVESDQVLIYISTRDFSFVAEDHLHEIFSHIARLRIKVNSMRNTAMSFMMCVRNESEKLQAFRDELDGAFEVNFTEGLELFTVRHATEDVLHRLRTGKTILHEERFGDTDQFVAR